MTAQSTLADEILRLTERRLSAEEFQALLSVPIGDDERARVLALIEWFCRRYPTPDERLAYVRKAYRRWSTAAAYQMSPTVKPSGKGSSGSTT